MVSLTLYNLINTWDIFKDKKYLNFLNNGCSTWFRSQLLISLISNSSQSVFTTKNDKRLMEHCILERMVNRSCSCQSNLNVSRILSVWQRCWPWNVCYRKIQIWPYQKSGMKEFEVHSEDSQCVGKHLSQADQSSHETRSYV